MAIQARTEFASALNQVCSERGLEPEVVIDSIKQAILAAYRKDYGEPEDILVDLNARKDCADFRGIFRHDDIFLGFSDALQYNLFGGLGGNAAKTWWGDCFLIFR